MEARRTRVKFSVRFNNDLPTADYARLARAAEDAGFDQFWVSDDLFLRSVWIILAQVAQATRRIQLGTCIVNPYTQHPAEIGYYGVVSAYAHLTGHSIPVTIGTGFTIMNKSNIADPNISKYLYSE